MCECAFAFANTCVSIYICFVNIYIYIYFYLYIYIYTAWFWNRTANRERNRKHRNRTGTVHIFHSHKPNPTGGNRTVWSANRKHELVANRLRTAGICLFSIYSSTGFFARVRPAIFLATCACAKISLAAEEKKGENGERRETGKSNGLESRYFRLRLQN